MKSEEFITFVKLERVRAANIVNAITKTLSDVDLSLNELQGQGYDGTSSMAGERSVYKRKFGICKRKPYILIVLVIPLILLL